ncbi:TPA: hypothetical protein RQK97_002805 [Vibrio vulnificus]|nr:hypothetical protein [Vibrio vulnificus]HAU8260100.1 hypothetical protein [Vibrio vulnificus]HDY7742752.1 hypothetical protein [Vibrio vulnificus]HDY7779518.1 hypothetical protein [Vibrio vulnificus]HDY8107825.1 hypothetical protein [Vibrio vulnificus]
MKNKTVWFAKRRYGWGWGVPTTWQGWMVLGSYCVALYITSSYFHPQSEPFTWALCIVIQTALLIAFCYWKGERPSWSWGE